MVSSVSSTGTTSSLDGLAGQVIETSGYPVDEKAVTALLESFGLRDVDSRKEYGYPNLFALGTAVYGVCRQREAQSKESERGRRKKGILRRLGRFVKFYLEGTLFAMPMSVQILFLLIAGYSLWAWLNFSEREATIIAIGTLSSYVVIGGFTQAISRRGMFYVFQELYPLAKTISYEFLQAGIVVALVAAIIAYIINLIIPIFPGKYIIICLMYFILLAFLWMNLSILYMLKNHIAIVVSAFLGMVFVWLVMRLTNWGIYIAHWIGIGAANVIAFLWGWVVISGRAKDVAGIKRLARLPRRSIILYTVTPYFWYGMIYFSFLFTDRVISWSASRMPQEYIIWFRTSYEVGIDVALISLILTIAMLEYTINEFSEMIIPVQEGFSAFKIKEHNRSFKSFYVQQLLLLAVIAILSIIVTYAVFHWLGTRPRTMYVPILKTSVTQPVPLFFGNPVTMFVFWAGMIGYAFTALGLLNAVFFNSLSRPKFAIRALLIGLAVNVVVGFILSRFVEYYYGVFGLVAGAIVFGVLSTIYLWRVFGSLEYYYYSSY